LHFLSVLFVIVFFFSSRRRHTRSKRDWSSDVCSSDLGSNVFGGGLFFDRSDVAWLGKPAAGTITTCPSALTSGWPLLTGVKQDRSEERRVGKECRSRWSADDAERKGEGWVLGR